MLEVRVYVEKKGLISYEDMKLTDVKPLGRSDTMPAIPALAKQIGYKFVLKIGMST